MSDPTALSFEHLPLEILQGILRYLDIPDILRLRRVSQYLKGISQHRDIWSDAYRRADYIRPPGPFLSQTAHDLEKALVSSFRVDQNLRHGADAGHSEREKPVLKLREIRYTGIALNVSLVFGRFLFVALSEEVRCYDLDLDAFDSNSVASILYRSNGGLLRSFHCVSAIDVDGRPFACAVMSEAAFRRTTQISIYLLHIDQSEVTLDLIYQFQNGQFDIEVVDLGPRVLIIQGRGDDADDWHLFAFDVRARTQLSVHAFSGQELDELASMEIFETTPLTAFSTSTHILLAKSFYSRVSGWCTFLEAFPIPPPRSYAYRRRVKDLDLDHSHPSTTTLTRSHRGFVPGINITDGTLLQDSTIDVDPTTKNKDVLIKIRVHAFETHRPRSPLSTYGYLRLRTSCPDSEIMNEAQSETETETETDLEKNVTTGTGTIEFQNLGSLGQLSHTPFLHPSLNGTGRAFYTLEPGSYGIIAALQYDVSGDSAGAAKTVHYPSILRFPTPRTLLDYDQYSGRICLRCAMARYSIIEILDFAV